MNTQEKINEKKTSAEAETALGGGLSLSWINFTGEAQERTFKNIAALESFKKMLQRAGLKIINK